MSWRLEIDEVLFNGFKNLVWLNLEKPKDIHLTSGSLFKINLYDSKNHKDLYEGELPLICISNSPNDDMIEMYFRIKMQNNGFSKRLHECLMDKSIRPNLQIKIEEIQYSLPMTNFVANDTKMIYICTGIGISPMLSYLKSVPFVHKDLKIIWGMKYLDDLRFYLNTFKKKEDEDRFWKHVHAVVFSKEIGSTCPSKYFNHHVQDVLKEEPELINPEYKYCIFGLPEMEKEMKELLLTNGVSDSNILMYKRKII